LQTSETFVYLILSRIGHFFGPYVNQIRLQSYLAFDLSQMLTGRNDDLTTVISMSSTWLLDVCVYHLVEIWGDTCRGAVVACFQILVVNFQSRSGEIFVEVLLLPVVGSSV